jgi:hypothetical protein
MISHNRRSIGIRDTSSQSTISSDGAGSVLRLSRWALDHTGTSFIGQILTDPRQRMHFVLVKNEGLPGRKAVLSKPRWRALIEAHDLLHEGE